MNAREIYNKLDYLEALWRYTESDDTEYISKLVKDSEDFAKQEFTEVKK